MRGPVYLLSSVSCMQNMVDNGGLLSGSDPPPGEREQSDKCCNTYSVVPMGRLLVSDCSKISQTRLFNAG